MDYKEQIAHLQYLEQKKKDIEATAKSEREYDTALQFRQAIGQQIAKLTARAEAAEARAEKAEKTLSALQCFSFGRPIINGPREVISFCGIPVEEAMQRVLDYPQLKKRAENAEKTLAELLEKNAKIQANMVNTVCVNVVPSNLYSDHDFYFEMYVKGFCKQCVFVFEDKNYSIEELCKVISKTFTDMLREYEAKSESGEK